MSEKKSGKLNRLFKKEKRDDLIEEQHEHPMPESSSASSQEGSSSPLATGYQTPFEPDNSAYLLARQHALSVMAEHTYQEAKKEELVCPIQHDQLDRQNLQVVALKISRGQYAFWPRDDEAVMPFVSSLCQLNVGVS